MKSSQKLNQISTHFYAIRLNSTLHKTGELADVVPACMTQAEALGNLLKGFSAESPRLRSSWTVKWMSRLGGARLLFISDRASSRISFI